MKFDFRKTLDGYKSVETKQAERLLESVLDQLKTNGIWGNRDYKKGDDVQFLFTLGKVDKKLAIQIYYCINQNKYERFLGNDFSYNDDRMTENVFTLLKEILQEDGHKVVNVSVEGQDEPTAFAIVI